MITFELNNVLKLAGFVSLSVLSVPTLATSASASPFTMTSPTSEGELPAGVSEVGGIVLDLVGSNGTRVTSQLAASELFVGFANVNPFEVGTQTGLDASVTGALGGGLQEVAVRFTLFDGDTAAGDFDENDNTLLLNGINFGNWSDVNAQNTDGSGNALVSGFSGGGFRNDLLDTGFFFSNDATTLDALYDSIVSTEQVVFEVNDVDSGDNFYDFTQGLDSSVVDVGTGPIVQPVPEPLTILGASAAIGFGGLFKKKVASKKSNKKA